jgi:cyclohexanone monooxygenase
VNFIREATYVSPPFAQESRTFTAQDHALFAQNPEHHLAMRREMEQAHNSGFAMFTPGTDLQIQRREYMISEMKRKLQNPELEKLLIPTWSLGCRRLTPGVNYLESLTDPKVEVVYGEIANITEKGVVTENGKEYAVDVLICATGFDTTFKPRFPLRGSTGELLSEVWKGKNQLFHLCDPSKLVTEHFQRCWWRAFQLLRRVSLPR